MPAALAFLPLLVPLIFGGVAVLAFQTPGRRPAALLRTAERSALVAMGIAGLVLLVLAVAGPASSALIGAWGVGFSARIDIVGALLLALVTFLGWAVLRYSAQYLDGEARQGAFVGWLSAVLASVALMVSAGNLVQLFIGWVGMSLALHQLLVFYPERRGAQIAAWKKAIIARASDSALLLGLTILWAGYGTSDIGTILAAAASGESFLGLGSAAAFLVAAAILKSAQIPLHGWLVEVMETPTPVSALLHAGVVNAGGMLILRFADVLLLAPGALVALVFIGGLTALWGAVVMLTQPAVKTQLAWSTVAQMGFMMVQAGLALFPLMLLHILAHSLYKAHSFLSAGGAVTRIKQATALNAPEPVAPIRVMGAMAAAGALYVVLAALVAGAIGAPLQALGLGAVLAFGLVALMVPAAARDPQPGLPLRMAGCALGVGLLYIALHGMMGGLAGGMLPAAPAATPGQITALMLLIGSFGAVAMLQATLPHWAGHPLARRARVHLSNGLYAGALLNRVAGGFNRAAA